MCRVLMREQPVSADDTTASAALTGGDRTTTAAPTEHQQLFKYGMIADFLRNFVIVMMMGACGIALPSIVNGVYFMLFVAVLSLWACSFHSGRLFTFLCYILLAYVALHLIAIHLDQFEFMQHTWDSHGNESLVERWDKIVSFIYLLWCWHFFVYPFSPMTLLVGWQEEHLACKKSCTSNPLKFSSGNLWGSRPDLDNLRQNGLVKQKLTALVVIAILSAFDMPSRYYLGFLISFFFLCDQFYKLLFLCGFELVLPVYLVGVWCACIKHWVAVDKNHRKKDGRDNWQSILWHLTPLEHQLTVCVGSGPGQCQSKETMVLPARTAQLG